MNYQNKYLKYKLKYLLEKDIYNNEKLIKENILFEEKKQEEVKIKIPILEQEEEKEKIKIEGGVKQNEDEIKVKIPILEEEKKEQKEEEKKEQKEEEKKDQEKKEQIKIPILEEEKKEKNEDKKEQNEDKKEQEKKEQIKIPILEEEKKEQIKIPIIEKEGKKIKNKIPIIEEEENKYIYLNNSDIKFPLEILPINKIYDDYNQNIYLQKSILQEQKKIIKQNTKIKISKEDEERFNEHNESLKQTSELNIKAILNILNICEIMFLKEYLYCSFINITDMNKLLLQTKSTTLFSYNYWDYKPNGYVLWCSLIRKIKWEDALNDAYLLFEYNIINEKDYKEYLYIPELLLSNLYNINNIINKNLLFIKLNNNKIISNNNLELNNYIHFMTTYKLNIPYIKWKELYDNNYSGIVYQNNDIKYNINDKLYDSSEIFYNWLFNTLVLWDYNAINSYVLFEKTKKFLFSKDVRSH
jgi:hypothetical protein